MFASYHYQNNCIYVKIQRSRIIGGTQIITNKRKMHLFDKIIHFYVQFSVVLSIFIVKTYLNSTFTNDLKRKQNFSKNVHSYRLCSFNQPDLKSKVYMTILHRTEEIHNTDIWMDFMLWLLLVERLFLHTG